MKSRSFLAVAALIGLGVISLSCGGAGAPIPPPNQNPQILLGPEASPTVITSGGLTNLTVDATDPNGDVLTYQWDQVSPPTPQGNFSTRFSRTTSWTAPFVSAPTLFTLQVTVSDGKGGTVRRDIQIQVNPAESPNRSPVIISGPSAPSTVLEGQSITLSVNAVDPDNDELLYEWKKTSPEPVEVIGNRNSILWQAPEVNASTVFTFTVQITDGKGGSVSGGVNVTVINANKPPTIEQISANPSSVPELGIVQLSVTATDPENQTLTAQWSQISPALPQGTFLPNNQGLQVLWRAPQVAQDTVFQIGTTVRDPQNATASASVLITVRNANRPPRILTDASASPSTIPDGETTLLTVVAIDEDGDEISYQWEQVTPAQPKGGFSSAQADTTNWRAPEVSTDTIFTLRVTVKDTQGASAASEVAVTVLSQSDPPFFTSPIQASRTTVPETETVNLSFTAVDPDGDPLSYEWSQVSPSTPVGSFSDISSPNTIWTAPEILHDTQFTLKVQVSDGLFTIERSITLLVLGDNDPPRILAGPSANPPSIWEKTPTQLSVTAEDPEGYPISYLWEQILPSTPQGSFSNPTQANTTWTAPNLVQDTTVTLRLTLQDPQGGVTQTTLDIPVRAINDAPVITSILANPSQITDARPNNVTLLTANAYDPEGETVTYLWTQVNPPSPEGYFESPTQSQTQWTAPILSANTIFTHRVQVTDAHGATSSRTVTVMVLDVNQPPEILEISANPETLDEKSCRLPPPGPDVRCFLRDANGNPQTDTQLNVVAIDPDGPVSALTYSWTQVKVEPSIPVNGVFSNSSIANPTWYVQEVPSTVSTDYVFTLQVTVRDARGGSDTRSIDILVFDINKPPVIRSLTAAPPSIWEAQNEENRQDWTRVTVDAYDPDEDGIDYQWFQIVPDPDNEPDLVGTFEDILAPSTRWFAPDMVRPLSIRYIDFTLRVRLNDGRNYFSITTGDLNVRVNQVNKSPRIVEGPTATPGAIDELTSSNLYVRVVEPDGDPVTFLWQQILPPSPQGTFSPDNAASVLWNAPDVRVWTDFEHRVTVWDQPPPGYPQRAVSRTVIVRVYNVYVWENFETLATTGRTGESCFVDTNSQGYPYIGYFDDNNDRHQLVFWDGSTWLREEIDAVSPTFGEAENLLELQFDRDDNLHISYATGGALAYRKRNADGTWDDPQTIHSGTNVGQYNSIGVDSNGKVHIGYYHGGLERLYYATNESGYWQIANADPTFQAGKYASLAFKNNLPSITHWWYKDGELSELRMAVRGGQPWQWSTFIIDMVDLQDRITNRWNEGKDTSLEVRPSDGRYILFSYDMDDGDLDYIEFLNPPAGDPSPCTLTPFACSSDAGRWNDLDLDLRGDWHVVFYDQDLKDLKYMFFERGTGRLFEINMDDTFISSDEEVTLGYHGSSIALDTHNNINICTYDASNEDLLYIAAFADRTDCENRGYTNCWP
ncbi:MAG: PKD domain-containing protein [bacterium JZ-2024 1]